MCLKNTLGAEIETQVQRTNVQMLERAPQNHPQLLWLEGMEPFHSEDDEVFTYKGVQPLCFKNEKTVLTAYFQPFDADNNPFFLAEYYSGSGR